MSTETEHNFEDGDKKELKNPVLDYLIKKNKTLINDYRMSDDSYLQESCVSIAGDIAKMLLNEGKRPEIVLITGKLVANPHITASERLKPVQYEGRVGWGSHVVCICDGLVYDPMIGRPLPLEEYIHRAFDTDVEIKTMDNMEEFVNR